MMPESMNRRLGTILMDLGFISEDELREALRIKETAPQRMVGRILVDLGFATDREVFQAVETQWEDWVKAHLN